MINNYLLKSLYHKITSLSSEHYSKNTSLCWTGVTVARPAQGTKLLRPVRDRMDRYPYYFMSLEPREEEVVN